MKKTNRRKKAVLLAAAMALVFAGIYACGILIPEQGVAGSFLNAKLPPCIEHPFGTDALGRDLLLRTLKGLSLSITIGLAASAISAIIALLVGIAAATGSKGADSLINWLIDLVMGVPHTILIILISFALGRGLKGLLAGIAATHWCSLARLIRGEVLQLRSQPSVAVSRKVGQPSPQIQPAIGIILAESMRYLSTGMWWMAMLPGLTLALLVLQIDKLGECLGMILDPYSAQE